MIGTFAHDETPLTVEGAPVPFAGLLPHHRHLAVRVPAQEPTAGEIDKGHKALGMPERSFRTPQPVVSWVGSVEARTWDRGSGIASLRHVTRVGWHACGLARGDHDGRGRPCPCLARRDSVALACGCQEPARSLSAPGLGVCRRPTWAPL